MSAMDSVTVGALALILGALASYLFRRAGLKRSAFGVVSALVVMQILQDALPAFLAAISREHFDWLSYLRIGSWEVGLALAVTYWALVLFNLGRKRRVTVAKRLGYMTSAALGPYPVFVSVLLIYPLAVLGKYHVNSIVFEKGFEAANLILHGGAQETLGVGLVRPFGTLFYPLSAYLFYWLSTYGQGKRYTIFKYFVVANAVFAAGFAVLITGGRGDLGAVVLAFVVPLWFLKGPAFAFRLVAVFLVLFTIVTPIVYQYRGDRAAYQGLTLEQRLSGFLDVFAGSKNDPGSGRFSPGVVVQRFDGVPHGGNLVLFTISVEGQHALLTPYIGAVASVVPRVVWPNKPVPLSGDGTPQSIPQWLSGYISGRPGMSTSVATSSILFWQFHLPGVLLGALFLAFLLNTLIVLGDDARRFDLVVLFVAVLHPFRSPDAVLMALMQWVMPLWILTVIIHWALLNKGRRASMRGKVGQRSTSAEMVHRM